MGRAKGHTTKTDMSGFGIMGSTRGRYEKDTLFAKLPSKEMLQERQSIIEQAQDYKYWTKALIFYKKHQARAEHPFMKELERLLSTYNDFDAYEKRRNWFAVIIDGVALESRTAKNVVVSPKQTLHLWAGDGNVAPRMKYDIDSQAKTLCHLSMAANPKGERYQRAYRGDWHTSAKYTGSQRKVCKNCAKHAEHYSETAEEKTPFVTLSGHEEKFDKPWPKYYFQELLKTKEEDLAKPGVRSTAMDKGKCMAYGNYLRNLLAMDPQASMQRFSDSSYADKKTDFTFEQFMDAVQSVLDEAASTGKLPPVIGESFVRRRIEDALGFL